MISDTVYSGQNVHLLRIVRQMTIFVLFFIQIMLLRNLKAIAKPDNIRRNCSTHTTPDSRLSWPIFYLQVNLSQLAKTAFSIVEMTTTECKLGVIDCLNIECQSKTLFLAIENTNVLQNLRSRLLPFRWALTPFLWMQPLNHTFNFAILPYMYCHVILSVQFTTRWLVWNCIYSEQLKLCATFSGPTVFDRNSGIEHYLWYYFYWHFLFLMT